ncbi:eukaryotic aspartyl protease-like protein 3 [Elsinoe australis]|uniref:Eukaryotic aspartyl protease-like protein 3 n=1 Tax=Elsinoe australis TaxID=40998 RepID=A0A4U7ANV8_9PEZI|nr:eukaryotic aspartyl protease-like protein 3 [Elsinoe australis]
MHFTSIVAAASVASVALAAPAPAPETNTLQKRSFKVERFRNANATRDPKVAMRKAFEKHGMHLIIMNPDESVGSFSSSSEDSTGLGDESSGSTFPSFGSGATGTSSGRGSAFRSWLSSLLGSATPVPEAGSGSSGSGSGVDQPAPAPAEPSAAPSADSGSSGSGNAARPTPTRAPTQQSSAAAPSASTPAAAPSGTGTGEVGEATTSPESNGACYLTPVQIGGQTLNMNLDTGSADLWVFDAASQNKGFNKGQSKSFKPLSGYSFKIGYGDGSSASGSVGTDTVSIGNAVVQNQAVELATTASAQFTSDTKTDGLVGLGFSNVNSVSPKQQKTFFDNVKEQLASPLFTVTLNEEGAGEYEFGTLDSSKYTGEIHYAPVNSARGYWQFESTSFQVNGKTIQNSNPTAAIADTGTSLCLVDTNVAQAYYAQVQGSQYDEEQGGYVYPCNAQLPTFGVALGSTGYYVTIPSNQITYAQAGQGTCFGGIQPNQGQGIQIFGDALLKEHFVVFDGNGPRVGFADRTASATGKAPA